uniref:NADH-ubiquinone oxidoreductase chain 4 n=1 Tax=Lacrimia lanifica TaxID=2016125 RepID=A0A6G5ZU00_9EUGL|nr:NADH dehydrogenase subunit 4 [Lacrimia lanifica]
MLLLLSVATSISDAVHTHHTVGLRDLVVVVWWGIDVFIVVDVFVVFVVVFVFCYSYAALSTSTRTSACTVESTLVVVVMQWCTILTVVTHELLVFYLMFELMLLLIYSTVATYWYTTRAVYSVYLLVAYTVVGSACMGVSLVMYYVIHGALHSLSGVDSVSHSVVSSTCTGILYIAFLTKIPTAPLHHWLVEAHVESTTEGSILLAGIYLKVGVVGWCRYCVSSHPVLTTYWYPTSILVITTSTVSLLCVLLPTLDLKRFAAVSSILHLQLVLLLLVPVQHTLLAVGTLLQVTTHSYIAALLFLVVGDVYEVLGSRCTKTHHYTSRTASIVLVLLLANSGYPCSASYTAEWCAVAYTTTSGSAVLALVLVTVGGMLSVLGLFHWVHSKQGRSRVHVGAHTLLSTTSALHLYSVGGLVVSTAPHALCYAVMYVYT